MDRATFEARKKAMVTDELLPEEQVEFDQTANIQEIIALMDPLIEDAPAGTRRAGLKRIRFNASIEVQRMKPGRN